MLLRIGLTLLIILLTAVAIYFFRQNGIMALVSLGFGIALIIAVWLVTRMGNVQGLQNQNAPQAIDRNTKKLTGIINDSFNDEGIDEIGRKTQSTIVETMNGINSGEYKTEKNCRRDTQTRATFKIL